MTSESASDHYIEVDVTGWLFLSDESLGTKPKRWLRDPVTGDQWLMKDATLSHRNDGTRYRKGDDWSERIANGVAERLGLPAARTELAVAGRGEDLAHGVISKYFLAAPAPGETHSEEELVDGNELLPDPVVKGHREGYTVEAVHSALNGIGPPASLEGHFDAWDVFVGYLILDAVVGNTDRHEENWAVIERAGERRLAPTFDHASCLGFQLDDDQRYRRLSTRDSGYTPEAWADRAGSTFHGSPHPVTAAVRAMTTSNTGPGRLWLSQCEDVDSLVEPVWMVPRHRMSTPAREFAERMLRRNCHRLLEESQ